MSASLFNLSHRIRATTDDWHRTRISDTAAEEDLFSAFMDHFASRLGASVIDKAKMNKELAERDALIRKLANKLAEV